MRRLARDSRPEQAVERLNFCQASAGPTGAAASGPPRWFAALAGTSGSEGEAVSRGISDKVDSGPIVEMTVGHREASSIVRFAEEADVPSCRAIDGHRVRIGRLCPESGRGLLSRALIASLGGTSSRTTASTLAAISCALAMNTGLVEPATRRHARRAVSHLYLYENCVAGMFRGEMR
jgi:hypothetical protein